MMVESGALTRYGPFEWPCSGRQSPSCSLRTRRLSSSQPSQGLLCAHLLVQGIQEHDGLHRLPQPHLIGQDCISPLGPGKSQPVEPFQLVRMERASRSIDVPRLFVKLNCRLNKKTQSSNQFPLPSLQSSTSLLATQDCPKRDADTALPLSTGAAVPSMQGFAACHHRTQRSAAPALRQLCKTGGQPGSLLSLTLSSHHKSLQGVIQAFHSTRPALPVHVRPAQVWGKETPNILVHR